MTPVVTVGPVTIAKWLGVTRAAVSNWLVRHSDTVPVPDVVITSELNEQWGWKPERRAEWEQWHREHIAPKPLRMTLKRRYGDQIDS
jgi:hypothetical protein